MSLPKEEYPNHWVPVTIEATGQYINGYAFKQSQRNTSGFPIIRIQNLTNKNSIFNFSKYIPDEKYIVTPGTLLVSWSATLDVYVWHGSKALLNQHIFKVIPDPKVVDRGFLFYLLKKVVADLRDSEMMRGTTMRHINRRPFLNHSISLPSLSEQKIIRDAVWKAFAHFEQIEKKLHQLLAKTATLKVLAYREALNGSLTKAWRQNNKNVESAQHLLQRALDARRTTAGRGKPIAAKYPQVKTSRNNDDNFIQEYSKLPELPPSWAWATLQQVADIRSGLTLNRTTMPTDGKLVPYLRVANVQRGWLDLTEVKEILVSAKDLAEKKLEDGDILFNEGGDRDKLGRGWIWEGQLEDCIHQNHVFRARLITDELEPRLISVWGNTFGQQYFEGFAKQTTNLASISLSKLAQLPIPIPPYREQREIISKMEAILDIADQQEKLIRRRLTTLTQLRQRVLNSALSGNLKFENLESLEAEEYFNPPVASLDRENFPVNLDEHKKDSEVTAVPQSLKQLLDGSPDGYTPTDLLRLSRYSGREIDDFYDELAALHSDGVIEQIQITEHFEPLIKTKKKIVNNNIQTA